MSEAKCNHVIEIHNDSGSTFCYLVREDGTDVGITTYVCTYCPECGQQLMEDRDGLEAGEAVSR